MSLRRHTTALKSIVAASAATAAAMFCSTAHAQTATGWKGTGGNSNWTTAANWDNTGPNAGARDLFFGAAWVTAGRTGSTTANNDVAGFNGHKIFFENITTPATFTLTGNGITLFDFGGATPVYPQIQNSSGATHIFSLNVTFNDTSASARGEINAVNGNLTFNNVVDLAGVTQLQVNSNNARTITFNGPITSSGNGGANSFALNQNTTVILKGAGTYTGSTFVNAGHLQFDVGGSLTSTIRLGNTSGTASASVDLIAPAGGITLERTINPRAGSTGNSLSFNSLNTSGTNIYDGHVGLDHDFLIAQTAGGQLNITQLRANPSDTTTGFDIKGFSQQFFVAGGGTINVLGNIYNSTGNGTVNKSGGGWMILGASNTYTGGTQVNDGTLQIGTGGTIGSIASTSAITAPGVGGTIAFNRSDAVAFSNPISGNVGIAQIGSGTTSLTGTNASTGATFVGNGTLEVGGPVDAGNLGSGAIVDNANLSFRRSAAFFTQSNPITGSGNVSQNGSGTLTLAGAHTYTGQTYANSGTLSIGNGTMTTSLQTSRVIDNAEVVLKAQATVNGASEVIVGNAAGANAAFRHRGGALTLTNGTLTVGAGAASATYDLESGSLTAKTINLSTNGLFRYNPAATWSFSNFNQSDGTFTTANVGDGVDIPAAGTYRLTGGTARMGLLFVGTDAGDGTFSQSGGTLSMNGNRYLTLGAGTGTGTYLMSGGVADVQQLTVGNIGKGFVDQSGGTISVGGALILGVAVSFGTGVGTYNLSGSGYVQSTFTEIANFADAGFTQTGGTHVTGNLLLGLGHAARYDLSGGVLTASSETVGVGSRGTFTQTGGTHTVSNALSLGANSSFDLQAGTLNAGTINIQAGATFDYASAANLSFGTLNQSGGNVNITGSLALPANSIYTLSGGNITGGQLAMGFGSRVNPSLIQSGGTITLDNDYAVGVDTTASVTQSGGVVNANGGDSLRIGMLSGGAGTYTLNGGTLNLNGLSFTGALKVGEQGNGTLLINGGQINVAQTVSLGVVNGANGFVRQTGGTMHVGSGTINGSVFVGRDTGAVGQYTDPDTAAEPAHR